MPITITEEMSEKDPFFEMGFKKGKEKGLQEAVIRMYEKLKLSPEKIASVLDIDLKTVKQILKEGNNMHLFSTNEILEKIYFPRKANRKACRKR